MLSTIYDTYALKLETFLIGILVAKPYINKPLAADPVNPYYCFKPNETTERNIMNIETLKNAVNGLCLEESGLCYKTLMGHVSHFESASHSNETLKDIVFGEYDALNAGELTDGTKYWDDVRDVQHDIVNYFSV